MLLLARRVNARQQRPTQQRKRPAMCSTPLQRLVSRQSQKRKETRSLPADLCPADPKRAPVNFQQRNKRQKKKYFRIFDATFCFTFTYHTYSSRACAKAYLFLHLCTHDNGNGNEPSLPKHGSNLQQKYYRSASSESEAGGAAPLDRASALRNLALTSDACARLDTLRNEPNPAASGTATATATATARKASVNAYLSYTSTRIQCPGGDGGRHSCVDVLNNDMT